MNTVYEKLRERLDDFASCPGCRGIDSKESKKSKYRGICKIRNCEQITNGPIKYCSDNSGNFPCASLKQLDKRYRTKYGMSMIENLNKINEVGIRNFIRSEKQKWICHECGEMICVHKPTCLSCGYKWQ